MKCHLQSVLFILLVLLTLTQTKKTCYNSLVVISCWLVHCPAVRSVIKIFKGLSGGHLVVPKGKIDYTSTILSSCLSNLFLKISNDEDFIISLGNLCQSITVLIIRKFFFPVCRITYWKTYQSLRIALR